jgi:hypothetical protein
MDFHKAPEKPLRKTVDNLWQAPVSSFSRSSPHNFH